MNLKYGRISTVICLLMTLTLSSTGQSYTELLNFVTTSINQSTCNGAKIYDISLEETNAKLFVGDRSFYYSFELNKITDISVNRNNNSNCSEITLRGGIYFKYTDGSFKSPVDKVSFGVSSEIVDRLKTTLSQIAELADKIFVKSKIERYVNEKLVLWQAKGEFEKTADYLVRVSEQNRKSAIQKWQQEKVDELSKAAAQKYNIGYFELKAYDADNESFLLQGKERGYVVSVPSASAQVFKQNFSTGNISDHQLVLTEEGFKLSAFLVNVPGAGKYSWSHTKDNPYQQTAINYNFDKAEINLPTAQVNNKQNNIEVKQINVGKSDVDTEIPAGSVTRKNTFVLIIGNEQYKNEIQVDYAVNDAETFKKYTETTLGVPAQNIHLVKDASYGEMLREIDWLSDVGKAYKQEAKLILYYAGHGMPDESSKSSYLLPIDGAASKINTAIALKDVYTKLSEGQSETVTVILDACFSGSARSGMLASGRGVIIKPKAEDIPANMIVLSAVSGEQTAHPFKEKGHGLFTYYLLKKLKESRGNISLGALSDYLGTEVGKQSVVTNNKVQNPEVKAGALLEGGWRVKVF